MNTATVFVNDDKWLRESEGILDVRFDTQCLPTGCWVACFIVRTPDGVQMVENVHYLPGVWEERYQHLKRYAISVLETGQGDEPDWLRNEDAIMSQQADKIIVYHLQPGQRFWDEYYGRMLTVSANEYDPRYNRSIIQTEEIQYAIIMDSHIFVPLKPPKHVL